MDDCREGVTMKTLAELVGGEIAGSDYKSLAAPISESLPVDNPVVTAELVTAGGRPQTRLVLHGADVSNPDVPVDIILFLAAGWTEWGSMETRIEDPALRANVLRACGLLQIAVADAMEA